MSLDAAVDFFHIEVLIAQNPSQFGYHHGPIHRGENLVISSINTRVCDVVVAAHGTIVIRRWVLEGGWRRARYFYEPRELHPNSLIMQYADDFELLAERYADFRDSFGSRFHRPYMVRSRVPQPLSATSSNASNDASNNGTEQDSSSDA
ncbi:hypothetical protein MY11210_001708 [Beauveria gryllotalpidicola]